MRKYLFLFLLTGTLIACGKNRLDPDRPLDVEFGPDVRYETDTLLYFNLSDDAGFDAADMQAYIRAKKAGVLLVLARSAQAAAILAQAPSWGCNHHYDGPEWNGKQALILCREKAVADISTLPGVAAASFPTYSLVTGIYSDTLMADTETLKGRIFLFESDDDPSDAWYRLSFINGIKAQWGSSVPTGREGKKDYVFARPEQWSRMGVLSLDGAPSARAHFPICFTIKKEL